MTERPEWIKLARYTYLQSAPWTPIQEILDEACNAYDELLKEREEVLRYLGAFVRCTERGGDDCNEFLADALRVLGVEEDPRGEWVEHEGKQWWVGRNEPPPTRRGKGTIVEKRKRLPLVIEDSDYSPEYQDEYQRLWHETARRRDELTTALREIAEWAKSSKVRQERFTVDDLVERPAAATNEAIQSFVLIRKRAEKELKK